MKAFIFSINKAKLILGLSIFILLVSCDDFLEPDKPLEQLPQEEVFANEATATAAVTSIFAKYRDEVLLTGKVNGLSFLLGIYTDELRYYGIPNDALGSFYSHQIVATNEQVESMWNQAYHVIYLSNAVIESLEKSTALADPIKARLKGEALFIRGLTHFYLVNLYGNIPFVETTDYIENSKVARLNTEEVYNQLVADLIQAKALLDTENNSLEKTRPDNWTVTALLARVYLYREQWDKAAIESSKLIEQAPYALEADITAVFGKDSEETLWQFYPKNAGDNTQEASTFYIASPPPQLAALSSDFIEEFETGDLRKQHWIGELSDDNSLWYFPYKYKAHQNTGMSLEYSIVFRLAEQYLIRAEARTQQGDIFGAQQDINAIRTRAGLANTTANNQTALMEAILAERKKELFTEHGHRWFDLRRLDNAEEVLSPLKPGWKPTNRLLPIPQAELLMNPQLKPQNPGY